MPGLLRIALISSTLLSPHRHRGRTVGVGVTVGVAVRVGVTVAVGVTVDVRVAVTVAVGVMVKVGVAVTVAVRVTVAVAVAVTVAVGVIVKVGVAVTVAVGVIVNVGVTVTVAVDVAVTVAVNVAVGIPGPTVDVGGVPYGPVGVGTGGAAVAGAFRRKTSLLTTLAEASPRCSVISPSTRMTSAAVHTPPAQSVPLRSKYLKVIPVT
jgi:hypothetical protein